MIAHFLVTRFNLRVAGWQTTKLGQQVLSDDWLHQRFYLFERFCLPSVKNQSDQHFTWCLYFDKETPDSFRSRIEQIVKDYENIAVFYIDGIAALIPSFQAFIKETIASDTKFVITTRLDNDDLVHQDFIKEIKKKFVPCKQAVIDLKEGYQLSIETPIPELRLLRNDFNPFISLIEAVPQIETVISRMHREWEKAERQIAVKNKRLWVELVHCTNKVNAVDRQSERTWMADLTEFGIPDKEIDLGSRLVIKSIKLRKRITAVIQRFIPAFSKQL